MNLGRSGPGGCPADRMLPAHNLSALDPSRTKQAPESQQPGVVLSCLHVLVTLQIKCPQSLPSIPEPSSCRLPTQCFPIKTLCRTVKTRLCAQPGDLAPALPPWTCPRADRSTQGPCLMLGTDPAWERAHMRRHNVHVYRRDREADGHGIFTSGNWSILTRQIRNIIVQCGRGSCALSPTPRPPRRGPHVGPLGHGSERWPSCRAQPASACSSPGCGPVPRLLRPLASPPVATRPI